MDTTKPPLDQIKTHATQVLDYRPGVQRATVLVSADPLRVTRLNIDAEYQGSRPRSRTSSFDS